LSCPQFASSPPPWDSTSAKWRTGAGRRRKKKPLRAVQPTPDRHVAAKKGPSVASKVRNVLWEYPLPRLEVVRLVLLAFAFLEAYALVGFPGAANVAPWSTAKLALISAEARRIRRRSLLGFHWLLGWKSAGSFFWPSHIWWRMQWDTWPRGANQNWL
jgi:hypothetical protein